MSQSSKNFPSRKEEETKALDQQVSNPVFFLPNIRKMFIPDPGKVIVDADLSGADAQVVAWEADDAKLKSAFRAGKSVHLMNGEDLLGVEFTQAAGHHKSPGTPKGKMYEALKRFVHGTNYLSSARNLHLNPSVGWSLAACELRQRRWFDLHPGIREWHKRVEYNINSTRSIRNKFGYRIVYFDRPDSVLTQAVAWGPQSTVAEVCFRGALKLKRSLPWAELLLQVHDSIVFQIPFHRAGEASTLDSIKRTLENPVPYSDPLTIQWGIASSETSWGDCK
jgi:DNA polymerase I-like protein with 3'-5' exonuclease and polymerase domains